MRRAQQFPELLGGFYFRVLSSAKRQERVSRMGDCQEVSEEVAALLKTSCGLKLFRPSGAQLPQQCFPSQSSHYGVMDTLACSCLTPAPKQVAPVPRVPFLVLTTLT